MDLNRLTTDSRDAIYTVIEIPQNSDPIKYEYDKEIGGLVVDRFMPGAMFYPCNYGFMPNSLSGDGDPLDVLVYTNYPIAAGAAIKVKPIGVLVTEDESGDDEKILAVPVDKCDASFKDVNSIDDLPKIFLDRISNFFERYKDLEPKKWVKVQGWKGRDDALKIVDEAVKRFKSK